MKLVGLLFSLYLLIPTIHASEGENFDDNILLHCDLGQGGMVRVALDHVERRLENLANDSTNVGKAASELLSLLHSAPKFDWTSEKIRESSAIKDHEEGTYASFVIEDEDIGVDKQMLFAQYVEDDNKKSITIKVDGLNCNSEKLFGVKSNSYRASLYFWELGFAELHVNFQKTNNGIDFPVNRVWKLGKNKLEWDVGFTDYKKI